MDIKEYVKKRDELLAAMDVDGMIKFTNENGIEFPSNKTIAMAAMHKARLQVTSMTDTQKEESREWLSGNGFSTSEFCFG